MKIAISAAGSGLDAQVDARFGRCSSFVIFDTETNECETIANSGTEASGGAGIAAAQQVAEKKPAAVLTGHCGPNAFKVLHAAGIKVYTDASGTVREAVEACQSGYLRFIDQADAGAHSGMEKG